MTSFVGQTSQIEMKQALARLQEIKANIIGTVVNNVKTTDSYRRYGYGYGYHYSAKKHPKRTPHKSRKTKTLLLGEVAGTTETTQ
jgi:Mrp family chromosome partitioning ATPase